MYNTPNIAISSKEKNTEKYHLQWAQSVVNTSFTSDWSVSYNKMKMLYDFFLYGTGNDIAGHLTAAPDGSSMPGIWTSQNTVRTRIRSLVGELEERSYIIKARALNTEAQARKLEERERLRVKRKLQGLVAEVQEDTGITLESSEYVPQSDEELREYMDLTWKDKNVLILEGALKWLAQRNEDDETRKRAFLDQFISNYSIARCEIVDGVPRLRGVDPLKFGHDRNCTDDLLTDATYFYEFFYEPLSTVAQRYQLDDKELQESYTMYGDGINNIVASDTDWGCMPNQVNRWYLRDTNAPKALVVKIVWRDYKTLAHKYEKKEEYNAEFYQDVSDQDIRERDKDKIEYKKIEVWRQATLIGGKFLREWGECKNQPRDLSTLQKAHPPYIVWKNEHFQGNTSSMVEQLLGLQTLKDIALYQLQIQMARAVGKVLVFDDAMMPEGETKETVMRRIKADGVVYVNTREYQNMSGNMNLFQEFDLALSQSIVQFMNIVDSLDRQMSLMSGMSPERMGEVQGSSTSTGTTTASIVQSNLTTSVFFKGFERWWSRCLQQEARLTKLAMAGQERFAPIIGDVGVDFLADNTDIDLDEFDVVVQSLPPMSQERSKLMEWIGISVQTGEISPADAFEFAMEPDLTVAVRMYQRKMKLRQRKLAQQEQAQAEAEERSQQQQMMFDAEQAQLDRDTETNIETNKSQTGLKKQMVGARTKLQQAKIQAFDR